MKVINDLHIGTARKSGTTVESQKALRGFLFDSMKSLFDTSDETILVNGDLFDTFNVPSEDLLETFKIMSEWLAGGGARLLFLSAGNHDLSRDSQKLSSFHLLGELLKMQFGRRVTVILEPTKVNLGVYGHHYIIPHLIDQVAFDEALANVPDYCKYVFIHANYNSPFAIHSDHSLNVSEEQAVKLVEAGHVLVFGHEHQARQFNGVVITGNQTPSSISDCLGNDDKNCLMVSQGTHKLVQTWKADGSFVRVDWREAHTVPEGAQFIRVEGDAELEEAAEAVKVISNLRQKHKAFVISNAVNVRTDELSQEFHDSVEDVKGFDILNFLLEALDESQASKVKELLKGATHD